jgi:hypothetical protein
MDALETERRREKLVELYRAKHTRFEAGWLDTVLRHTEGVGESGFGYAINAAIATPGLKFPDLIPFIKHHSREPAKAEHERRKQDGMSEAIRAYSDDRREYMQRIRDTLEFHDWPEGTSYMDFHTNLKAGWDACETEGERNKVLAEARKLFEDIRGRETVQNDRHNKPIVSKSDTKPEITSVTPELSDPPEPMPTSEDIPF